MHPKLQLSNNQHILWPETEKNICDANILMTILTMNDIDLRCIHNISIVALRV